MATASFGPYRIVAPLQTGGMGVVHRAEHGETGEVVALKTARTRRAAELAGIRDEVTALRRLAHPGIVRIVADGSVDGAPWYVMELLEGRSLADLLALWWRPFREGAEHAISGEQATLGTEGSAPSTSGTFAHRATDPADSDSRGGRSGERPIARAHPHVVARAPAGAGRLDEALTLALRLARTLAFLHGEGVVHRDLKPDNIIVEADGAPVLLDFGLATRALGTVEREELTAAGSTVGTAAYMAPEQVLGQFVDARADVYALGCILFELVTGAPPFAAPSARALLEKHASEAPPRPSSIVDDVSPELDSLLLRLLEKQPRDRLGHGDDVAAALLTLGADGAPLARDAAAPPPRAYLYRPEMAGRAEILDQLGARAREVERGEGGLVLLGGESGIGKTAVAAELARRIKRTRRMQIVLGQCVTMDAIARPGAEVSSGSLEALQPFFRLIGDRCLDEGREAADRLLGSRGNVLCPYAPALRDAPGQDAYPEPIALPPEGARDRLLAALAETLAAFADELPTLLVIDDLQWADELTLRLLAALANGSLAAGKTLIVVTYRTEETTDAIRALLAAPRTLGLELGRLEEGTVGSIVGDMLAMERPPAPFVKFLARNAEGNPFFVAEYLRAAVAEGLLTREAGAWKLTETAGGEAETTRYEALPLPRSLRALSGLRLSRLSPIAHRIVEALAVLGREAEREILAAAAGLADDALGDPIRELCARQVLETPREGTLRFVHDKLREVAYAALEPDARRALHLAAARAIEAQGSTDAHAAALAYHFGQAGEEREEALYAGVAGIHAQDGYAHREAIALLGRAVVLHERAGTTGMALARLEYTLGMAHQNHKEIGAAAQHQAEALRALGVTPYRKGVRVIPGLLVQLLRQVRRRLLPRRAITASAERRAELLLASKAMASLATTLLYESDGPGVIFTSLSALNLAEEAGSTNYLSLGILGWAAGSMGLDRAAEGYFARLDVEGLGAWDRNQAGFGKLFAGNHLIASGRLPEAEAKGHALLAEMQELGDRNLQGYASYNLAIIAYLGGRLVDAAHHFHAALAVSTESEPRHRAVFVSGAALVAMLQGRPDQAEDLLRSSEGAFSGKDPLPEAAWHGAFALLHQERGALTEARAEALLALQHLPMPRASMSHGAVALAGAAEALFACLRDARARGADARPITREIEGMLKAYRGWAAGYPVGKPEALLQEGRFAWLAGKRDKARKRIGESLSASERAGMVLHQGLAHRSLAETFDEADAARASHLAAAEERFREAGAEGLRSRPLP